MAEALRTRYPRLSVLHRRAKEGLGRAYVHGFEVALGEGYRRVVTMDADLSHAPEDVPRLLAALEEAEVAIGSRRAPGGGVAGWPLHRRLLSRAGSLYARSLLGLPVLDVTSGFRAYRADALKELDLEAIDSRGFVFQVEVLRRLLDLPGARAVEVPILFRNRSRGSSKLNMGILLEAAREVARLRTRPRKMGGASPRGREAITAERAVSAIVAAHPEEGDLPALSAMGGLKPQPAEVLIARGRCPARQRNLAAKRSQGEFLLFLDDDSRPEPDLLESYLETMRADSRIAAAGGPAVFSPGSVFQDAASLVLGEPWVVGRTAARYRPLGKERHTDERELILCNLIIRQGCIRGGRRLPG